MVFVNRREHMPCTNKDVFLDTRFDRLFEENLHSNALAWYPWVGEQYTAAPVKVLVVLESHYINKERSNLEAISKPDFTRRIVLEQIRQDWHSNTFDNLALCLTGAPICGASMAALWSKVALYNFVQRPMSSPSARPTAADFSAGWHTFCLIADILRPDVCIFAGFEAINHLDNLPNDLRITGTAPWEKDAIGGVYPRPRFEIIRPWGSIVGTAVRHPGAFFSPDKWRAVLERQIPKTMPFLKGKYK